MDDDASEFSSGVPSKWFAILTLDIEAPTLNSAAVGKRVGLSERRVQEIRADPRYHAMRSRRARRLVEAVVIGTLEDGVDARAVIRRAMTNGITSGPQEDGEPHLTPDGVSRAGDGPDDPVDAARVELARDSRTQAARLAQAILRADAQAKRPTVTEAPAQAATTARTLDDLLEESREEDVRAQMMREIAILEGPEEATKIIPEK